MTESGVGIEVLSFGEALMDFLPGRLGARLREIDTYTRCLGGAPANLAYGVARLGGKVAFMGRCGDDEFGHYLRETLERAGVDVRGISHDSGARTGIVFVEIDADGERSFTFYGHPSADMTIAPENVNPEVIQESQIFHTGTNLMTMSQPREANLLAMRLARDAGRVISLDANIRPHHWPSREAIQADILGLMQWVDVLKANEAEAEFLFGPLSPEEMYRDFLAPRGVKALLLTQGGEGSTVVTADLQVTVAAPRVRVIDTTGAGDAFLAGTLRALSLKLSPCGPAPGAWLLGLQQLSDDDWRDILGLANHMGATACTRFGATTALPTRDDIPWETFGFSC